jgi:phthalate 4,5-dioxygenase oxygenase subunit
MPPEVADWTELCAVDALEAGGAPKRMTIAGERLIAFRLPDGTPGLLQEACAHRCASLVLARSEDEGLRCIYHGWKFAPDGTVLEIPTEPDEARRKAMRNNVRIKAYPVEERDGALWARITTATTAS